MPRDVRDANDDDDDDDVGWLIEAAGKQLDAHGIDGVVAAFTPVLSEFENYLEGVAVPEPYLKRLTSFVSFLKHSFELPTTVMLVQSGKYTTDMWGPLYWSFLHYASILLQYAMQVGLADDVGDFPTLLYNIDMMLPCGICVSHYNTIKSGNRIRYAVKLVAFGHVVQGVYQFHDAIAENVHGHRDVKIAPPFRPFSPIDFALHYHCYPITTAGEEGHKSTVYSRPALDWQQPLHTSVCVLLAVHYKVSLSRVSKYLKRAYGGRDAQTAYPRPTVYTVEEKQFEYYTRRHDIYDALKTSLTNTAVFAKGPAGGDDEKKDAYERWAVETIRAALSAAGRKTLIVTYNAALENDSFGD